MEKGGERGRRRGKHPLTLKLSTDLEGTQLKELCHGSERHNETAWRDYILRVLGLCATINKQKISADD